MFGPGSLSDNLADCKHSVEREWNNAECSRVNGIVCLLIEFVGQRIEVEVIE